MGSLFSRERERVRFAPGVPLTLRQARLLVEQNLVNTPVEEYVRDVYPLGHELYIPNFDPEVVEFLLANGADTSCCEVVNGKTSSALNLVGMITFGSIINTAKKVRLLLDYGADAASSDILIHIFDLGDIKTFNRLISYGARLNNDWLCALPYRPLITLVDPRISKFILQSIEYLPHTIYPIPMHPIHFREVDRTIILTFVIEGM